MNKIKLNQLDMLVAVADSGSFSKAARELDCTQSRISHAIAELEAHVGARLLERAHGGSTPTDAGHRVLLRARQILRLADNMLASELADDGIVALVRLACFRSIGTHVLPHGLARLMREHPGIRVEIDDRCDNADDVEAAVREGRADLGIGCLPVPPDLASRPLLQDDYVLLVPRSFALRAPLTWDQLATLPLIESISRRGAAVLEQMRADGLTAPASHRLTSDGGIMAMIGLGLGFSVFPRLATLPLGEGVKVVEAPLAFRRAFMLIARPEVARAPAVKTLMRVLADKRALAQTPAYRAGMFHLD